MAEKLTNEQQAAVDSRERSLLVSAAAGSGKTKVLVERLFSYVEREGANLDDFLIITYTRTFHKIEYLSRSHLPYFQLQHILRYVVP